MKLSRQLLRYGLVGLSVNLGMFLLYLMFVAIGTPYVLAMTLVYCLGLVFTFVTNKNWTFQQNAKINSGSGYRFIISYGIGYLVNLVFLMLMVSRMGIKHEFAQAGLICVIAVGLFAAQRLWVFPTNKATVISK